MPKHKIAHIAKTFRLYVLMVASALIGCSYHGDVDSNSGCGLSEELCGSWQFENTEAGVKITLVDGLLTTTVTRNEKDNPIKKITIYQRMKHAKTTTLKDGRTAYFSYSQDMDAYYLFEGGNLLNAPQEKKDRFTSAFEIDLESRGVRGMHCSVASIKMQTLTMRCSNKFTEQNTPDRVLITLENGRLCRTDTKVGSKTYPSEPVVADIRNCLQRL